MIRVFGIGLSKTGTNSLNTALNTLGFNTIHGPHDSKTQEEMMAGVSRLTILESRNGITDIPAALYYSEFDIEYPNSKFILTIRDIDAWLYSMQQHYARTNVGQWNLFTRACAFGSIGFNMRRSRFAYERHVRNVQEYFKNRDNLLILDICGGEGWEKLCDFLDKPIPNTPFPRQNQAPIRLI